MKMCSQCSGTGNIFGGVKPLRWATCIVCKGTSFAEGKPIDPTHIIMHTISKPELKSDEEICIDSTELPENALMAHVMAKAGIFKSISQARKNGWDKPLEKGVFIVTKRKIRIEVI